ncbi:unnamed protein product, partial [Rotaria sp. Silwood2]
MVRDSGSEGDAGMYLDKVTNFIFVEDSIDKNRTFIYSDRQHEYYRRSNIFSYGLDE